MVVFPKTKINLGLRIVGRRADGFHNLESVFYPLPFGDVLEAIPSNQLCLTIHGLPIEGKLDQNLCIRAWRLLHRQFDIDPVEMHLLKNVPTGSGLGGGSADGACTLKMLNSLFDLDLAPEVLCDLAGDLGSDCPFFLSDGPALVKGRGESIQPIDLSLSGYWLLLIFPGIHISTKEAFAAISVDPDSTSLVEEAIALPVSDWKRGLHNDFEPYAFQKYPELAEVKDNLYNIGAEYASMTGSGSAIYGVFKDKPAPSELRPGYRCKLLQL